MTFADGAAPLADAANYATCGALAQLVIRLVPDPRQLPLWGLPFRKHDQ